MTHVRVMEHFDAPVERVFELGIDFERYPEWSTVYTEVKEIKGPPGQVGTRVYTVMRLLGKTTEGWGEIVEIEKPRLLKIVGSTPTGGKLEQTMTLAPEGSGTELVVEADYEVAPGLLGGFTDKLFVERAVERELRHSLENFKALVEMRIPALA